MMLIFAYIGSQLMCLFTPWHLRVLKGRDGQAELTCTAGYIPR